MKKLLLLILFITTLNSAVSCKKDEPEPPTKTELLTNGIWIGVTQETYLDDVLSETHPIPFLRYDFKSNNTVYHDNNDDDLWDTGTWSFESDETKLKMRGSPVDILVLTQERLVFSVLFAGSGGEMGKWVQTFKH